MLIVEGPDGSGKTTLARKLSKDLGMPVAPRAVAADTTALVDIARWTEDNVDKGFQYTIFDRHRLISEPIYGPVLRGRQDPKFIDMGWMSDMVWRFYASKPILIYCLPDIRTVWKNVSRPETNNQVVSDVPVIEAIYAGYVHQATMDFSRGVGRLFNYESTMYDDILRWTKFKLEEANDRAGSPRILAAPAS
jgi:hypothetical protein